MGHDWRYLLIVPEVISPAEDQVGSCVESGAFLTEATITAGTLETVFMPVSVYSLEHEAVLDPPLAAGTALRLSICIKIHYLYYWKTQRTIVGQAHRRLIFGPNSF